MSDFEDIAHKTVAELFDMLKEKQYTVDALSEINHEKDLEIADLKTQLNNMEACYIGMNNENRIDLLNLHIHLGRSQGLDVSYLIELRSLRYLQSWDLYL